MDLHNCTSVAICLQAALCLRAGKKRRDCLRCNVGSGAIWTRFRRVGSTCLVPIVWVIWLFCGAGWLELNGAEVGHTGKPKSASTNSTQGASNRNRKPPPLRAGTRPTPRPWVVEGESADSLFAYHVAAAGDVNADGCAEFLICEPKFKNGTGRVLAYYGSTNGLAAKPSWVVEGLSEGASFGYWAEGAGDVDQDGFDDVVVLARPAPTLPETTATAYLFRGSPLGLSSNASWQITAQSLSVSAFVTAGRAGDVNGDGFSDLYIYAFINTGAGQKYRVFIFHGSPNGPKATPDTQWDLDDTPSDVSLRSACAGDVNGDGYDDLIIGVPKWNGRTKARGRVLVYHGSPQGLNPTPAWTATYDLPAQKDVDEDYEQHFGWSAASAGDVNGDGFSDIIVGAPFAERGDLNEGLAFVYHGSPQGLSHKPQWIVESNHAHALLGFSVSGAGDVNGDGFDDVIVGVPYATDGQYNEGAALVFHGSKRGLHHSPDWSVESDNTRQFMGEEVVGVGDVNGDGYADVLVASPDFSRDGKKVGRVNLFYGTPKGLLNSFDWSIDKPWLMAMEQWLDRVSEGRKMTAGGALVLLSAALFVVWRRTAARMRRAENENVRNFERERLARDVHDHLGADLSHIALWSELTKGSPHGSEETRDNLDQIAKTARSALSSISELVWRLDPTNDRLENFAARLEYLAQQALLRSGLRLTLDFPDVLPQATLGSSARTDLAFMLEETLRNVVQHAMASQVTVELRIGPSHTLCVRVKDNGKGFVVSVPNDAQSGRSASGGHGLRNLQARAANLGGKIQIESTPGQGTSVTITVPLNRN
jgi:signal transduction histidine kinase